MISKGSNFVYHFLKSEIVEKWQYSWLFYIQRWQHSPRPNAPRGPKHWVLLSWLHTSQNQLSKHTKSILICINMFLENEYNLGLNLICAVVSPSESNWHCLLKLHSYNFKGLTCLCVQMHFIQSGILQNYCTLCLWCLHGAYRSTDQRKKAGSHSLLSILLHQMAV